MRFFFERDFDFLFYSGSILFRLPFPDIWKSEDCRRSRLCRHRRATLKVPGKLNDSLGCRAAWATVFSRRSPVRLCRSYWKTGPIAPGRPNPWTTPPSRAWCYCSVGRVSSNSLNCPTHPNECRLYDNGACSRTANVSRISRKLVPECTANSSWRSIWTSPSPPSRWKLFVTWRWSIATDRPTLLRSLKHLSIIR